MSILTNPVILANIFASFDYSESRTTIYFLIDLPQEMFYTPPSFLMVLWRPRRFCDSPAFLELKLLKHPTARSGFAP